MAGPTAQVADMRGLAQICVTCAELRGFVRTCGDLWGLRTYAELRGLAVKCADLHGLVGTCADLHGLVRTCMDLWGLARTCGDLRWLVRTCGDLGRLVRTCADSRTCVDFEGLVADLCRLARTFGDLWGLAFTCIHFDCDHICWQVDTNLSPFGHPMQTTFSGIKLEKVWHELLLV